ncbi:serum amyloid P-component-like [Styela clava]
MSATENNRKHEGALIHDSENLGDLEREVAAYVESQLVNDLNGVTTEAMDESIATTTEAMDESIATTTEAMDESIATTTEAMDESIATTTEAMDESIATTTEAMDESIATTLFIQTSTSIDTTESYDNNKKCPQYTFGFPNRRQIQDYVVVNASIPDMTEVTVCAWVSPIYGQHVDGAVFSYATPGSDNTLLIEFEPELSVYLYSKRLTLDEIGNRNENHICVVVSTINNTVHLYLNGSKHSRKTLTHEITKIKGQGTVVLGQDQDEKLGGFQAEDSFLGVIKNCMLWNRTLTSREIEDMQNDCNCPKDYILSATKNDHIVGNVTSEFFDTC